MVMIGEVVFKRLCLFLALLLCLFVSCKAPIELPESGVFFCEVLDLTLDFETSEGFYTADGVDYLLKFDIENDSFVKITHYSDGTLLLKGTMIYENGTVTLSTVDGEKYVFELKK